MAGYRRASSAGTTVVPALPTVTVAVVAPPYVEVTQPVLARAVGAGLHLDAVEAAVLADGLGQVGAGVAAAARARHGDLHAVDRVAVRVLDPPGDRELLARSRLAPERTVSRAVSSTTVTVTVSVPSYQVVAGTGRVGVAEVVATQGQVERVRAGAVGGGRGHGRLVVAGDEGVHDDPGHRGAPAAPGR